MARVLFTRTMKIAATVSLTIIALIYILDTQHCRSVLTPSGRHMNEIVLDYDSQLRAIFNRLLLRKASAVDPELVQLVRKLIDPPSTRILKDPKWSTNVWSTQETEAWNLLQQKVTLLNLTPTEDSAHKTYTNRRYGS